MPRLTGLFSAEANYIQTATSLQVSAEANVEKLTYERQPVGDIGLGATWLPGEQGKQYLNAYLNHDQVEVLVAGHHGSNTSNTPELLEAANPGLALISAGLDNKYGHPGWETLVRLEEIGADIYRTDLYGTIEIQLNES